MLSIEPGSRNRCDLQRENHAYRETGGVSANNRHAGFLPAYRNELTGEIVVSRFADGTVAPVHVLDGLPPEWVAERDAAGHVCQIIAEVEAGFVRNDIFYTRAEAARAIADEARDR